MLPRAAANPRRDDVTVVFGRRVRVRQELPRRMAWPMRWVGGREQLGAGQV